MFCVFVGCLPGITQPGFSTCSLRRSTLRGRGGGPRLAAPPGPRFPIAKFWYCIQCLQLVYITVDSVDSPQLLYTRTVYTCLQS